jgi:hypothetical protein
VHHKCRCKVRTQRQHVPQGTLSGLQYRIYLDPCALWSCYIDLVTSAFQRLIDCTKTCDKPCATKASQPP